MTLVIIVSNQKATLRIELLYINVEQMASLSLKSLNVTLEMLGFIPKELKYQRKYKKDVANVCFRKDNKIKPKHFRALGANEIHGN